MPTATADLFLLEYAEDVSGTGQLAASGLRTLRIVADWIKTFVTRPNKDLGRAGPACPLVPVALERNTLGSLLSTSPAAAHHRLSNL
jgi:hypothetical protein